MKNKSIAILVLLLAVPALCYCNQKEHFEKFYLTNFKPFKASFNTMNYLQDYSKEKFAGYNLFSIDKHLIISNYSKRNNKSLITPTRFIKNKILPLYYSVTNEAVILMYDGIYMDEYGAMEYQCWIKSFTKEGVSIDSLKLAHLVDYEGRSVRLFSEVLDLDNINIKYYERTEKESRDGQISVDTINLRIPFFLNSKNTFYAKSGKPFVYKTAYGYSSYEETLKEYHRVCLRPRESQLGDVSNGKNLDFISLVNRNVEKCKGNYIDLIISISDYQGLLTYEGTQGGMNLDPKLYNAHNLNIKNNLIIFDVENNSGKIARMYYEYDVRKALCFLVKVEIIVSGNVIQKNQPENEKIHFGMSLRFIKENL